MPARDEIDLLPPKGVRPPLIGPGQDFNTVTDRIGGVVLTKHTPVFWILIFSMGAMLAGMLTTAVAYLLFKGTGIWGINIPVGWGFAIINFVWWIGIGHAGTLISAILLLFKQSWRTSINRFAEAMTIFAVMQAGLFPLIHTGRPWLAVYWLFPYPNSMGVWPQFRSPLIWDVFAVSTYFTVSFLFWGIGLIPDFATLRDSAKTLVVRRIYGMLAMGWRGSARHWNRYETAYMLLAGLATPLVLSVHSVVSLDFAVSVIPGWHTTFFPPYFVAGAIYSGFAMVLILAIPFRSLYHLEDYITLRHLQNCGKLMLATGLIVAYSYSMEVFFGWYSHNKFEWSMIVNRMTGPYAFYYWMLILCNIAIPQLLWFNTVRSKPWKLFCVAIVVNTGMWLERYVIVVTSLQRDFLPSSWGMYWFTKWDVMIFVGTMGFFTLLFFLFIRFMPAISIFEMRTLLPQAKVKE
ncbi:MAG TPA: NrfD/PsrC family molybdoenzyme membrane anchor subunit [Candidatus Angelobacter sp.]|jgi:molybdopterin-containing oxidoreductase family membrane subunit|nr:NrfD/PsrC family molybdoenzyme membrane anchor subunit [Candidatus Angelobacter sp.]